MAYGDDSSPARFLQGQTSNDRQLLLDVFGGEVITAFDMALVIGDKVEVKTVGGGQRSWRFPKVWKATAEYHSPGKEMLGLDIDTGEITVTIDDILTSHIALSDIDTMLSHFDVRSKFSMEMGRALARIYDKNTARQIILAARTAADGPFPGGQVVTDSALINTGITNKGATGSDWLDGINAAKKLLWDDDVPETMPLYMAVNWDVFDAIKNARAESASGVYYGDYRLQDNRLNDQVDIARAQNVLHVDDVTIFRTRNLPTANETSDTSVYPKYRANYSTTTGIMWNPMAVATLKLMDIGFEVTRDTRRLEDFMVAKMLVGHGTLRPEAAVEFKTS